jgi:hypothetical protein
MSMRTSTDTSLVEAAAKLADMALDPARAAQLVPAMDGFYALMDVLHSTELGETPPAIAFHASWAGR